jgi:hypothetical protein
MLEQFLGQIFDRVEGVYFTFKQFLGQIFNRVKGVSFTFKLQGFKLLWGPRCEFGAHAK